MNTISGISLVQYRNYTSATFQFPQPVTCITGPNGSGKTNLLDAVYYLCFTKSYFSAQQQNSAQNGTDGFRVSGNFESNGRKDTIVCKWRAGKKEVLKNDTEYEKITDHIGAYPAVMIAPDDIELINGHSEPRRKWVDGILSQADREYLERLMRYQRLLQQRNAWLKNEAIKATGDSTELEYYNACMSTDADYIYSRRAAFLTDFRPMLTDIYHRLCGGNEHLDICYSCDLQQKPLSEWLQQGLEHDLRYQRTLRGIHRDDWEFSLNGMSVKQFGSQGQKKSYLFALKLAQYTWLSATLKQQPILLLDDIFEKLDQNRMEALLRIIRSDAFGQVLLTDTHAERIRNAFGNSEEVGYIYLRPNTPLLPTEG